MTKREAAKVEAARLASIERERESRLFVAAFTGDKAEYLRVCEEVAAERSAQYAQVSK